MGDLKGWRGISHHAGTFGDYVVYGFRYVSEDGELAWHTTSFPNGNPIHDYWIVNGEFHAMSMHYFYNLTPETRVWIGDVVPDIDPEEKNAVLDAVEKWEREDAGKQGVNPSMVAFEYLVLEHVGNGKVNTVASKGGFPTEDDAKAAGEEAAARIAQSFSTTLTVDVRLIRSPLA